MLPVNERFKSSCIPPELLSPSFLAGRYYCVFFSILIAAVLQNETFGKVPLNKIGLVATEFCINIY